ncbi:hypothetical protein LTSEUGA_6005 [Salmonella enterica subsp. enterica serovar Uganda str. R8-3404]|uniref:Uncharacterized protein n=1 Tax=Salmonella enterica subsp. enterica serovar Uganda str. R8-3404 TaxID=913083 RepID=A0A6C8GTX2_SALET|nr:hypothetical protein LTSEUGA_6005 [Salmonella enterica subsp. enterica serovar Uganda str. R8-3404]
MNIDSTHMSNECRFDSLTVSLCFRAYTSAKLTTSFIIG